MFKRFFWILSFPLLIYLGTSYFTPNSPSPSRPVILYSNQLGDDLQRTYVQAIENAKHSLFVVIYSLYDRKVISALNDAALKGKDVTIIVDPKASKEVKHLLRDPIKLIYREAFGIMHRKILVTDHRYVWLGSANLTRASLKMHDNLVVGTESPELANYLENTENDDPFHSPLSLKLGKQQAEMWLLPEHTRAPEHLIQMIQSAQKTIRVAMFTFTHKKLGIALAEAHERGVDVQVVLDKKSSYSTSQKIAHLLSDAGVPLRVNHTHHLLHHKFAIIDDKLVMGSTNWTHSAFTKNDDCFLTLTPLLSSQRRYLDKLWARIEQESELFKQKF